MKYLSAGSCLILLILGYPALGGEIFHWVDEEGVLHFSDWAPQNSRVEVLKLTVSDSNPADYDPNEDQNSILGQAERINERWTTLKLRREERRKQRLELEQQQRRRQTIEYDDPYYNDSYFYYRPVHGLGFSHRRPFKIQMRQHFALDQLGLTGPRPHSINSSAQLARINAGKAFHGDVRARHPGHAHHSSTVEEW